MPTLREYFVSESTEYFAQLAEQLNRLDAGPTDASGLLRAARALRGSAQLAREHRVYKAGLGLEAAARAVSKGGLQWNSDVSGRARRTIEDLQSLVSATEADDAADARVKRVLERWREIGVALPAEGAGAPATERSAASKQFREFAAHEVAGIAAEIDSSLSQLAHDPRNRDTLKAILRRQRALLGAARLEEIGVVAETLRAVEDLVRVIHKLNVAVKEEWAAVFRAARDVLGASLDPLRQGNDPGATPALSKLRTLRSELLERYGEGEAVNVSGAPPRDPMATPAAPEASAQTAASATQTAPTEPKEAAISPAPTPAAPAPAATPAETAAEPAAPANEGDAPMNTMQPSPAPEEANDRVVPIEELCYSGERAIRRAIELRPRLETLAGDDSDARDTVDELFDLLRLGIG